jgi:predicted TIM-barrel fold metal-dependent hydrolase
MTALSLTRLEPLVHPYWGSDWPRATEMHQKPDDALLDLLAQAVSDKTVLSKILVTNPAELCRFE